MNRFKKLTSMKGVTLIELLIVISIISILAAIGIPQYGRFIANNKVKNVASDLLQNMRLARTMAIKENRGYLVTFNEAGANSYSIGFDGNGNNKLTDISDGYGAGVVRTVDLAQAYGIDIVFGLGTASGPDEPDQCPNCINIAGSTVAFGVTANPVMQQFNPDGSVSFTGSVLMTHAERDYTYMLRISNQAGKIDLWKWDGDNEIPAPPITNNCNSAPVKYCAWTEIR